MKIIFPPMSKNNNIKIMLMQEFIKIFRNFDWQRFRLAESPFLTIFFQFHTGYHNQLFLREKVSQSKIPRWELFHMDTFALIRSSPHKSTIRKKKP